MSTPNRQIRAVHSDETITVYQAYDPVIADRAVEAQTFVPPFKRERMTWIKPSFLWMMYRSGWAAKPGQERVLAVELRREGFLWALAHAALSHYDHALHADRAAWARSVRSRPVRVQWDPERDRHLRALPYRSLQVGLSGEAVERYVGEWIVSIDDVTAMAVRLREEVRAGVAEVVLPAERPFPLPVDVAERIGATVSAG
ncbi:protein of unknown function [Sinosporangium album]|uniref:DUF4291 domain-containing protein n=1 Tax=Sinosporangium album TaxID=504805 RepID=A0A1G8G1X2_9ACTN|nr:DUF4291 domain-containing protein [Sinosporangium album]SDH88377.1 protein of unknown function [Sinosporangium album]